MTAILDGVMTQLIEMISAAARPPLVLVKISVRPVIHWCLIWHSKKQTQQNQAQEKVRKRDSAARLKCGPREMEI